MNQKDRGPAHNRKRFTPKGMSEKQRIEDQRELEAEQALLRRLPPQQIANVLSARWQVTERTAWNYIARVRARWEHESANEGSQGARDAARAHLRASLNDVYSKAMGRRGQVLDATGQPILDAAGQPTYQERPDLNNAIKAARLLVDLDALQQPPPVQALTIAATVQATVDPADAAALSAYLTRIAPPSE